MRLRPSLCLIVSGVLLCALRAGANAADQIPRLVDVPLAIAGVHPELVNRRAKLMQQRVALHTRFQQHNSQCSSVVAGTAEDVACMSARSQLSAALKDHIAETSAFNEAVRAAAVSAADRELGQLDGRIARTRASLARLALRGGRLQSDIDQWTKLSEDARVEAHSQLMSALASLGLRWIEARVDSRELQALRQESLLVGVWPSIAGSPLQRLRAELLTQIPEAKGDKDILSAIRIASTVSGVSQALGAAYVDPKDLNAWLMGGISLIQSIVSDPVLRLALTDAKLAVPVLYGWTVAYHENIALTDVTRLGEAQYKEASILTTLYMKQLRERNELLKIQQRGE